MAAKISKKSTKSSSKSNPIVAIAIGCFVLLVIVGFGLSYAMKYFVKKAGVGFLQGVVENKTGVKTNLSELDKGNMTFTDSKTGQKVTVGSQSLPENFPTDFPVYSGAKLVGSISGAQTGTEGYLVTFTTPDASAKVVAYYQKELVARGWTTTESFKVENIQTWTIQKAENSGSLSIASEKELTTILVTLGSK